MANKPDFPPDTQNDEPIKNPLENYSVDVAAAEPVKKKGRSKRRKPAEPSPGDIGVGEQSEAAPGDTGDATGDTAKIETAPVAEKSPEEKRAELIENIRRRAEAGWQIAVDKGEKPKREDYITENKKSLEKDKREERFKTLTKEQRDLFNSLIKDHEAIKAQDVIDLFAAGLSLDDIKNVKNGFWGGIKSPMFEKPMSKEEFNSWVKNKIDAKNKEWSEASEKELGEAWDEHRRKFIKDAVGEELVRVEQKIGEAKKKERREAEIAKKIDEAVKESDKAKEARGEIDKEMLVEDRMELLNDLRNQWRDMEKMNAVLLPKHKDYGKKIKAIDGVIYDPNTDKEKIKDALQQNTADIILKAEILSGENIRKGAEGKTGKAYKKYLTDRVKEIFDEQIKLIEKVETERTGKEQHIKFTKKGTAPTSKPVTPLETPPVGAENTPVVNNPAQEEGLIGDYNDGGDFLEYDELPPEGWVDTEPISAPTPENVELPKKGREEKKPEVLEVYKTLKIGDKIEFSDSYGFTESMRVVDKYYNDGFVPLLKVERADGAVQEIVVDWLIHSIKKLPEEPMAEKPRKKRSLWDKILGRNKE